MTAELRPLIDIPAGKLQSPRHGILVWPYLLGQYRIQLTRIDQRDPFAPAGHGGIVEQMCTYKPARAAEIVLALIVQDDPEAFVRSLARPWNCDGPGGRIRLDNEPGDRGEPE